MMPCLGANVEPQRRLYPAHRVASQASMPHRQPAVVFEGTWPCRPHYRGTTPLHRSAHRWFDASCRPGVHEETLLHISQPARPRRSGLRQSRERNTQDLRCRPVRMNRALLGRLQFGGVQSLRCTSSKTGRQKEEEGPSWRAWCHSWPITASMPTRLQIPPDLPRDSPSESGTAPQKLRTCSPERPPFFATRDTSPNEATGQSLRLPR
ncbi:hypothetical protein F5X68DRAFT_206105 [Plectosphaerella plurivora]|uniref:Uncharacterized protein n=1 Tax=Plectosphaerella plurivora TaxID=936078 RepID=A0A9P8VD44_9PEZI|nr:hypothetical protein F5X68DRAFT_206105 [Plectosphaerella plurivora]